MLKNGRGGGRPGAPWVLLLDKLQYNFCTIKQLLRAASKHMEI
jgi:hypothetical protein